MTFDRREFLHILNATLRARMEQDQRLADAISSLSAHANNLEADVQDYETRADVRAMPSERDVDQAIRGSCESAAQRAAVRKFLRYLAKQSRNAHYKRLADMVTP